MKFILIYDGEEVGSFDITDAKLGELSGDAEILAKMPLVLFGGDEMGDYMRDPESDEELMSIIDSWACSEGYTIAKATEKSLRKFGTSEGACLREQRLGHKLHSCVGADFVKGLIRDRAKIGHPKHNVRLGKVGEQIAAQLMTKYQAHERWSDAHDLSDDKLIEVKTIRGDSTPIMPHSKELKLAAMDSTGKDMSMILLKVEEDRIRVFEHQFSDSFRSGGKDAVYVVSINDSTELGYLDENGDFQEMEA